MPFDRFALLVSGRCSGSKRVEEGRRALIPILRTSGGHWRRIGDGRSGLRSNVAEVSRYEDLIVWQLADRLSARVRSAAKSFPKEERFELTTQLRRAVRSIPANIVEGSGQKGPRAFARYVRMALGSLRETEYWLKEACEDGYLAKDVHESLRGDIRHLRILTFRLLRGLERKAS